MMLSTLVASILSANAVGCSSVSTTVLSSGAVIWSGDVTVIRLKTRFE